MVGFFGTRGVRRLVSVYASLSFNYHPWTVELAALMGFKRYIDGCAFLANDRGALGREWQSDTGFVLRKTREKRHSTGFTTNEQAQLR
jgi:hypothetical protein